MMAMAMLVIINHIVKYLESLSWTLGWMKLHLVQKLQTPAANWCPPRDVCLFLSLYVVNISKNTCNYRYTHTPLYIYIYCMCMYIYIYWLVVSTPLKHMKVEWADYSQYMESHKIHVPNHQPVYINILYVYCVYKEDMQWISTSIPTWSAAVALLAGSSLLDLGCSDPTHGPREVYTGII